MNERILPLLLLPALAFSCADDGNENDDGAAGTLDSDTGTAMGESESGSDTDTPSATGNADSGDSDTGISAADESTGGVPVSGIPVLGDGTHDIDNVDVTVISSPEDGLNFPTDVEFKPGETLELWVSNREDFSIVIYTDAGLPGQLADKRQAGFDNGAHFLAKPAALAFNGDGTSFATAQQENEVTQPGDPADGGFMGPTLWSGDYDVFQGGHQSHLDMLHNSPLSSGIAWESENTYWVFDGTHGSLTRYMFNATHGLGGTDHTDGEIYRYADGELGYEHSVPSHVVVDGNYVYAADSGNGRIVRLDPTTAAEANAIIPNYDGCEMAYMNDAELITLVDGSALEAEMTTPSGIELHDGMLFVTDPIQGRVFAFDTDGTLLDWLDTGFPAGSLMGLAFDDDGNMWVADAVGNQVHRFSAPAR
ncbi:MAG: PQQ-binding-like beta-propeller repeat protein [Nannocystaceae bacterium]|nr:PQQ-binding-like beta-propeller repeat protein [Nannocystaceae bacterium]